jgi:hypothetical protein
VGPRGGTPERDVQRSGAAVCGHGDFLIHIGVAKSSCSSSEGASCVEFVLIPGTVHVRDFKHRDTGPRLALTPESRTRFLPFASEG